VLRYMHINREREREGDTTFFFYFLMVVIRANKRKKINDDEDQNLSRSFALLVCFCLCRMMTTNEKRENVFREKKIFIDEPEKRTRRKRKEKKESSRFWYGDGCWIRSSWDLITSILKRVHIHTYVYSATVCVYSPTISPNRPTNVCARRLVKEKNRVNNTSVNRSIV